MKGQRNECIHSGYGGSSGCSVLGQFSHLRNQLSLTQGGRGVHLHLQPEAPPAPTGLTTSLPSNQSCKRPPSPQLLMPMIKGTVMPLQGFIHSAGRVYQLCTECWAGREHRDVVGGRKPFYSRVRLGVKEHPAQLPIPQLLRAHL